jgi:hypothetical protein
MPERSRRELMLRRVVAWSLGWIFAGALYLLLIDLTSLPELLVGAGAAALAATGLELAREQQLVGESIRMRWLGRVYRPVAKVPSDIWFVSSLAVRQLLSPRAEVGQFRTAPFKSGQNEEQEMGRRALAESFGSFAPNTIIVGVDPERELILGHQLRRTGGPEAIDVLGLG